MRRLYSIMTITLLTLTAVYGLITNEAQAVTVEETFEYSGIKELQVDGMFFKVRVEGYSGNIVQGVVKIPKKLARDNYVEVSHVKRGTTLTVRVEKKKVVIPPFSDEAVIEIRVPVDAGIDLKTASGVIEIRLIDTDEIRLSSSSGKIYAQDLTAGGVSVRSSSGAISIDGCRGTLQIESSSGRVTAREVTGDISTDTSSGAQAYEAIEGNIDAQSSSGKISISDQTGTLKLRATSGVLEGNDIHLKGDSSFTTSSGKISFDFINDIDEFSFDLNSSSGMLSAGKSRAKGMLVFGSGKIQIIGKSTSGAQTYR
jgi:lia operon protein LiaG